MSETTNIANELEKLDELRTRGVITSEEFEARKRSIFSPTAPTTKVKQKRPGTFLAVSIIAASLLVGAAYGGNGAVILGTMFGLFFYLLPAFIAYQRWHANRHAILVINLFLGWSIIGWLGALIWSATSATTKSTAASVALIVGALAASSMLSADARSEELYPNITREHIAAYRDLDDKAYLCESKSILKAKLSDADDSRLHRAIYLAAENAKIDRKAIMDDPNRFSKSSEYDKIWNAMEFIHYPNRPTERVSGGLRYTMTESEWLSEKQRRLQLATEWCTSVSRQLRTMLQILDAPR